MKFSKKRFFIMFLLIMLPSLNVFGGYEYKPYRAHKGKDITPVDAYRMKKSNPENTFLIDVRTRGEYQFVGHAEGAYNIPFMFLSNDVDKTGYKYIPNPDFLRELKALFNTETDTLLIYCKSGGRSLLAVEAAVSAGFPEEKVFNIMGGFEGDPVKNPESIYYNIPYYGGWLREGLPWNYNMDFSLMYQPDIRKQE